ncbi:YwiC-like family protein [Arcanobacterium phocisimile]|uniref:YwiC-like family protein n=1 Tax=Arcanobacterium phocisimile TaxID=1302235 RepID=A0ABX7IGQ9_9ACTO|nr:YwiC-like family protein [Arcanobacterium phocisimile]QRV02306.1 YwiC-like family protein [Arcanobacterium phocisimile]
MAARRRTQWIPNYHGAWAMVGIPPLVGIAIGGFTWTHILVLMLWWIGYFAFFATGLWLRSGHKSRYFTPVIAYSLPCVALGLILAFLEPELLRWVPIFLPLILVTFRQSAMRRDRSLLNDTVTVAAASLMVAVSAHVGSFAHPDLSWSRTWVTTGFVFGYFMGTVFYVKTNIRERGRTSWLVASIAWHVAWLGCATSISSHAITIAGIELSSWHTGLWVVLALRAGAVPLWGARHGWVSAKALGIGEIVFALAFSLTLLIPSFS